MGVDKKKIIEKIINIILDIVIVMFGIILLISIYNNVQTKILKNSYSSFFGYTVFGVQTGSMADAINAGDWIIVKKQDNFKTKDIVTYVQDGEFITHRIVESYKNTFITKGDANNTKDSPINKEQIVGKVVKILPNFEILRKTLFNPIVLLFLMITLYLAIILFRKDNKNNSTFDYKTIVDKIKNIKWFDNFRNIKIKDKVCEIKDKNEKRDVIQVIEEDNNDSEEHNEIEEHNVGEEQINDDKDEIIVPSEDVSLDDLDKTMCFRVISVNKNEIENTYNKRIIVADENEPVSKEIKEVEKEEVIKKNLDLLQKKGKKCKTIIEKCMYIKELELDKIVDILLDGESKNNYKTIKNEFIEGYIDARYYSSCKDINVAYNNRNKVKKLDETLLDISRDIVKKYKGSDTKYEEKVLLFNDIFGVVNFIDNTNRDLTLKEKRDVYFKKIKKELNFDEIEDRKVKGFVDEIIKVQKLHFGMIKYTLDRLDTNLFKANYSSLSSKNMYAVMLDHNIAFSKIYSDYIVDKTYTEGIVAEDKIQVLLTLLSKELVTNMLNGDFSKKYVIYIPESVYKKENKLDDIFEMFSDEFAKLSIIVLVEYSNLSDNKDIIKKLIKQGYHFAININDTAKFKVSDQAMFELVDNLFISNKNPFKESVLLFLNKDMHNKIIYDDISNKIGN